MSLPTLTTIGIVGLGYVGLPLAAALGRRFRTIGFDRSERRVAACRMSRDDLGEVGEAELRAAVMAEFTCEARRLGAADIVIVAVPTHLTDGNMPDFASLLSACECIGPHLKADAIVVFESTVHPGATERVCIPALENASGKRWKRDFFVGYSPERINPGDPQHRLQSIVKVVSADTPETLAKVAALYETIVEAGVHRASSIRVAETAKVLENTQRDLNIALVNELAIVCHRMGIDTGEVLEAAGTKWNFLPFRPGLVGGHCVGAAPHFLAHAAESAGHVPRVLRAGRPINDGMGKFVGEQVVELVAANGLAAAGRRAIVLGLTFKENCSDIRNSKVVDLVRSLESHGITVAVHDPRAGSAEAMEAYGIALVDFFSLPVADVLVVAVAHDEYREMALDDLLSRLSPGGCVIDVKSVLAKDGVAGRGFRYWRL